MTQFDPRAVTDFAVAAERAAGGDPDVDLIHRLIAGDMERLQAAEAAFTGVSPAARCRVWVTVSCRTATVERGVDEQGSFDDAGPITYMQRSPINTGPETRVPIGWGGGFCYTIGRCTVCINYECRA